MGKISNDKLKSVDSNRLRDQYVTDSITGYSLYEAVEDDGMRFGIGSIMVIIQFVVFVLIILFIGFTEWSEPSLIMGVLIFQEVKFVAILMAYAVFQIPCFIIAKKYKDKHFLAIVSHDVTYTVIVGVIMLILGMIFFRVVL